MGGPPPMQGPSGAPAEQKASGKPGKRGFFDAIRDLFFRQS